MNKMFRNAKKYIGAAAVAILSLSAVLADAQTSAPSAAAASKRKITVEKPALEKIRTQTLDPASPFYFPKLMAKFTRNDTTMTNEEYRNF